MSSALASINDTALSVQPINAKGLELRAIGLIKNYRILTDRIAPKNHTDSMSYLRAKYAARTVNNAMVYESDADFTHICRTLCEKLGQPDLFPILQEDKHEESTLQHFFDAIETDGVTPAQAAILGVVLGYDSQALETLHATSGASLPFTISHARQLWQDIITDMHPADTAPNFKAVTINQNKIDPNLASALRGTSAKDFPAYVPDPSNRRHVSEEQLEKEIDAELEAESEYKEVLKKPKSNLLLEALEALEESKERSEHIPEFSLEVRDGLIGLATGRLLEFMANNYMIHSKEAPNNLYAALSHAAAQNKKDGSFKDGDEEKGKIDFDESKIAEILDGKDHLTATEWAKNHKPLIAMLTVLLGNPPKRELIPFVKFMCGAGQLRGATSMNGEEADEVDIDEDSDAVDHEADERKPRAIRAFKEMEKQQIQAIDRAERRLTESPNDTTIGNDLFNDLININTTISQKGDAPLSGTDFRTTNQKIADFLAGQALRKGAAISGRTDKFNALSKLIEETRHGKAIDKREFDKFGSDALENIVTRIILRKVRTPSIGRVMKIITAGREYHSPVGIYSLAYPNGSERNGHATSENGHIPSDNGNGVHTNGTYCGIPVIGAAIGAAAVETVIKSDIAIPSKEFAFTSPPRKTSNFNRIKETRTQICYYSQSS